METKYYLAVDIGASSGRHILAHMEDDKIIIEEIYRFHNGAVEQNGHKVWETDRFLRELIAGMKACREAGKVPVSMGIDTWGVDYALLDKNDELAAPTYAYRDARTNGMDKAVYEIVPEDKLYDRTGIQRAIYNTIYQLMASKKTEPEVLDRAESMLMMPDFLHFLLTGKKCQEYTNATTSGLVDAKTNDWDYDLIKKLGYPERLFGKLSMPGTVVGGLREEIQKEVGFDCKVVLPATHDTGSAVLAVPSESDEALYLSSGTWSLLGCELKEANCSKEAREANFTNEGGYDHRYRFLKNIMGLWMIQSVRDELKAKGQEHSFAELCDMAEEAEGDVTVDANDDRFLAPASMIEEIQKAVTEAGGKKPETPGELARVIYRSLAVCYDKSIKNLESITGKKYDSLHIVGGGSNADYLNRLTAEMTGRKVYAGPGEGSSLGNLGAQMIADGVFSDLYDFRKAVKRSFEVKEY
ncbi:MAG: rhamnulokinase [Lachnospiraceae bacterium]|nr:rhamnulokinase [Lachnospiraceae bacterium]